MMYLLSDYEFIADAFVMCLFFRKLVRHPDLLLRDASAFGGVCKPRLVRRKVRLCRALFLCAQVSRRCAAHQNQNAQDVRERTSRAKPIARKPFW
ncbi:hypothetical protein AX768_24650 [Burkholderia sp. PAMC 28687]|nr:hypothetical protein AX768_24650 [Burkholderia sp. PAMC 28687]